MNFDSCQKPRSERRNAAGEEDSDDGCLTCGGPEPCLRSYH
jgi:hypothetical protein